MNADATAPILTYKTLLRGLLVPGTGWCWLMDSTPTPLVSVSKVVESKESVVIHVSAVRKEGLPMWTDKNRAKYSRDHLRYPSDVTDEEWKHLEPLIPPAKRGGRKREVDMREVLNGVMYVLGTGCQWRYIPKTCPPKARCIVISATGGMTVRWIASITCCTSNAARNSNVKLAPRRASLIVRASKALKKGGAD